MKKTKILLPILGIAAISSSLVPALVSCSKNKDEKTIELDVTATSTGQQVKGFFFSNNKVKEGEDFVTIVRWEVLIGGPNLYANKYTININGKSIGQNTINNPNGWVVMSHGENEIEFRIPFHAFDEALSVTDKPQISFKLDMQRSYIDNGVTLNSWSTNVWTDGEDTYQGLTGTVDVNTSTDDYVEVEIPLNKWAESKELPKNQTLYFAIRNVDSQSSINVDTDDIGDAYLGLAPLKPHTATISGVGTVIAFDAPTEGWGNIGYLSTINFYYEPTTSAKTEFVLVEPNKEVMFYNIVAQSSAAISFRTFSYSSKQSIKGDDFLTTIMWTGEHAYAGSLSVSVNGTSISQDGAEPGYHMVSVGRNQMTLLFDKELFAGATETPNISVIINLETSEAKDYINIDNWKEDFVVGDDHFDLLYSEPTYISSSGYYEMNIKLMNWGNGESIPSSTGNLYLGLYDVENSNWIHIDDNDGIRNLRYGQKNIVNHDQGTTPWQDFVEITLDEGESWGTKVGMLSTLNGIIQFSRGHDSVQLVIGVEHQA